MMMEQVIRAETGNNWGEWVASSGDAWSWLHIV